MIHISAFSQYLVSEAYIIMADIITPGYKMIVIIGAVQESSFTAGEVWALVASQVIVLTLAV